MPQVALLPMHAPPPAAQHAFHTPVRSMHRASRGCACCACRVCGNCCELQLPGWVRCRLPLPSLAALRWPPSQRQVVLWGWGMPSGPKSQPPALQRQPRDQPEVQGGVLPLLLYAYKSLLWPGPAPLLLRAPEASDMLAELQEQLLAGAVTHAPRVVTPTAARSGPEWMPWDALAKFQGAAELAHEQEQAAGAAAARAPRPGREAQAAAPPSPPAPSGLTRALRQEAPAPAAAPPALAAAAAGHGPGGGGNGGGGTDAFTRLLASMYGPSHHDSSAQPRASSSVPSPRSGSPGAASGAGPSPHMAPDVEGSSAAGSTSIPPPAAPAPPPPQPAHPSSPRAASGQLSRAASNSNPGGSSLHVAQQPPLQHPQSGSIDQGSPTGSPTRMRQQLEQSPTHGGRGRGDGQAAGRPRHVPKKPPQTRGFGSAQPRWKDQGDGRRC